MTIKDRVLVALKFFLPLISCILCIYIGYVGGKHIADHWYAEHQPINAQWLAFGKEEKDVKTFHHCSNIGGSANSPHLYDVSKIYQCDEGKIEISGQWTQTIEYGYVYTQSLGEPTLEEPRRATDADYKDYKWCSTPKPWDPNQKERCGDKPGICWDGKIGTWDPDWQGYSCTTPDHDGKRGRTEE